MSIFLEISKLLAGLILLQFDLFQPSSIHLEKFLNLLNHLILILMKVGNAIKQDRRLNINYIENYEIFFLGL